MAVERVPSMPDRTVRDDLAPATDVVAGHHQVEVAQRVGRLDDEKAACRQLAGDGAGDLVRRQPGLVGEQLVEPVSDPWKRASRQDANQAGSPPPRRRSGAQRRGRPRTAGSAQTPTRDRPDLDVVAAQQPGHLVRQWACRPRRRARCASRARRRESSREQRSACVPVRGCCWLRQEGASRQPSASTRAGGSASSPATTTVRG